MISLVEHFDAKLYHGGTVVDFRSGSADPGALSYYSFNQGIHE